MIYNYQLLGLPMLCWAFIIFAIAIIMFMPSGKRRSESAKEILLRKFADGTLSQEQYEESKSILAKDTLKKSSSWF